MANEILLRGSILTFTQDPFHVPEAESYRYIEDGYILCSDGMVEEVGNFSNCPKNMLFEDFSGCLITAGFIDTHVHFPQTPMISAYGLRLLEWLEKYTFPTELKFRDKALSKEVAEIFLKNSLQAGTTTAMVYGTVFKESVNAFFEASERLNTRMICGKVLMDRNAPDGLLESAEDAYDSTVELIDKWHNNGRQLYAVTPRFAPTCSDALLEVAGKIYRNYPDVFVQTHLCENKGEIEWVNELFPDRKSYSDVYDHYGLMGERSVFGHCIHFDDDDFKLIHERKASIAHCPSSNLFLGSGLFKMKQAKQGEYPVKVGLGTDLGAGTSFSQLMSLEESYKIAQLQGETLTALQGYYLATRGGADSLDLLDKIGSIEVGMEADFAVWDFHSTDLIDYRMRFAETLEEKLFVQMMIADDRSVRATFVSGKKIYDRDRVYYLG